MTLMDKFELVRHAVEFFFYLITGPLVTIFVWKRVTRRRDSEAYLLEMQKQMLKLAEANPVGFRRSIAPLVATLDSNLGLDAGPNESGSASLPTDSRSER